MSGFLPVAKGTLALLLRRGKITQSTVEELLKENHSGLIPLFDVLKKSELSAEAFAKFLSEQFGLPIFDLTKFDLDTIPSTLLNEQLIQKHAVLPLFKRQNRIFIATADPSNQSALEDFRFNLRLPTEPVLVNADELAKAIDKLLEKTGSALDIGDVNDAELADLAVDDESDRDQDIGTGKEDDAPIVIYINKLLMDAIRKGASDLHFEPYEKSYRVRFRIDGILHEVAAPPVSVANRLAARIKVMSKLDIAERRIPQDGRIKLRLSRKKAIDFRVSTLPTLWGEKIVMRILDSSSTQLGIDMLGYEPEQKRLYLEALHKPQGMILVTGPTGSGKTVSLYTGLHILNTEERNISTAEDPVEINLPGVNQVQIHTKAGMTFASALRAFLRQDPDIIMVGEIRDLETAEISIKAAQTGHLVLSTLHTNSASETLTRLVNMGVPPYNIASSVTLVIAQRLGRRLCPVCKQPEHLPKDELLRQGFSPRQIEEGFTLYRPVGCSECTGGYKGRVGVYETMPMTEALAKIIMEGGNSLDIAAQAQREGIKNLRQSGLEKARQGVTSLAEVNRVTSY
ncbi:type IV-A pilus assembly ATPase PilB [Gallaecimonas pentaromativorans]|uniref:protein-secreting ATPase n=1 Tax=Gallaecimonas pentaromativorans TaxID=584787 RepID=A0A3N1PPT3_9GAMM|nr:type IV-A pilus assembly ATPase PilB [Gallaecimonas pentaromativorans]ROQ30755.1 type IV pilus assembly protein PilB [Gallaecimonas pentaromativorans]